MASQTITANFTETILVPDANDILVVNKNVIGTVVGIAVDAADEAAGKSITIKGSVAATENAPSDTSVALDIGASKSLADVDISVTIAKTGKLEAVDFGIRMFSDDSMIVNAGAIQADIGIHGRFSNTVLTNNGDIIGALSAVRSLGIGVEIINNGLMKSTAGPTLDLLADTTVRNSGTIESTGADAAIVFGAAGTNLLVNRGRVAGEENAFAGSTGKDILVNYGRIEGIIDLGNGGDFFANRQGNLTQAVKGGLGNDTYVAIGRAFDIEEGQTGGIDTVRSNVSFTLSDFVEKLVLTGNADINGTSGNLGAELTGNGGDNRLKAGNGKDVLDGGGGNDLLTGGAFGDRFVFADGMGRDTVADFDELDVIDLRQISAAPDLTSVLEQAHQQGNNVVIDFGGGDRLTLRATELADLTAEHFVFFGESAAG